MNSFSFDFYYNFTIIIWNHCAYFVYIARIYEKFGYDASEIDPIYIGLATK